MSKRNTRPRIKRPRVIRRKTSGITFDNYLESLSRFGGTQLGRLADGAAEQLNIRFDAAQVEIFLPEGRRTIVDRLIYNPLTAIYIEAMQQDSRPDVIHRDNSIHSALRSMGYRVVLLGWRGLVSDSLHEVRKVMYAI